MKHNKELIISNTLKRLGVSSSLQGYSYLRHAISLTMDDMSLVHNVTKSLYIMVAEHFETTSTRVERSMRHAIENAWSRNFSEDVEVIFGSTVSFDRGKPTNGEFIATVADYLLIVAEEI